MAVVDRPASPETPGTLKGREPRGGKCGMVVSGLRKPAKDLRKQAQHGMFFI
jgi:hypothetical protein